MARPQTFAALKAAAVKSKQQAILDAAEVMFAVRPFNKVSLRAIARQAGISHATIYRYFPDRQALFVEAFVRGVKKIDGKIQTIMAAEKEDAIQQVAAAFVDFLATNDHYFKMMTHFMLDGDIKPELLDKLNLIARSLLERFEILLQKSGATKDTRLLAHSFFAALNGILITFRDYPGRSRQDVHRHMKLLARLTAAVFKSGAAANR